MGPRSVGPGPRQRAAEPLRAPPPPPRLCDIPSGGGFFTGPWAVTSSSLRMLRWGAAFCRSLRPVLLMVSFPRSRSPVVGVLGLCWMWYGVPFARQQRPIIGVLGMCWLLPGSFDCFCCPRASVHRASIACPPPPPQAHHAACTSSAAPPTGMYGGEGGGGGVGLVWVGLASTRPVAPPSQSVRRPKAWECKEAPSPRLPLPWGRHMGSAHATFDPQGLGTPRDSIRRSLACASAVQPLDQPFRLGGGSEREGGVVMVWYGMVCPTVFREASRPHPHAPPCGWPGSGG